MTVWETIAVVGEGLVILGSAVGGLVYIGYHNREHLVLSKADNDLKKQLDTLQDEHNDTMVNCPVKEISVEHKEVMAAVRDVREQKIDLASGTQRFQRIESNMVSMHGEIAVIQNKLENMVATKLDTLSSKVDKMLGYMAAKTKDNDFGRGEL